MCYIVDINSDLQLSLVQPTKNLEKLSEFQQNYLTSANSNDFSNCEERLAEISPASSSKNLVVIFFCFPGKICGYKFYEFVRNFLGNQISY
jgi:hypothetical protein